jgi:hypothetical protein
MTLTDRDKRLLPLLVIALVGIIARFFMLRSESAPAEATAAAPVVERQLTRLRAVESTIPGKETLLKSAREQLATLEKGLIEAETAGQAQAQLLQTIRRLGKVEGIDARGGEIGQVRALGDSYGEVSVAVNFDCGIEQLLNLLAALSNEPKLLATEDLRISSANAKDKRINVRLAISGVVDKRLVPERKGPTL